MRKISEIRNDLAQARQALVDVDRNDKKACEEALARVNDLIAELDEASAAERAAQRLAEDTFREKERKANKKFSVVKFFRELASGQGLTGIEAEAAEEGAREFSRLGFNAQGRVIPSFLIRDILGQSVSSDGAALAEETARIMMPDLNNQLVVERLGATVLTNLVGKVSVVTSANIAAKWAAEGTDVEISKTNWAKQMLTPKRNVTRMALTKDLLHQTSAAVEQYLVNKMRTAHNELVEAGVIAGAADGPTGILKTTGVVKKDVAGAISWKEVVGLETRVNVNNASRGKLGYLTNAKVMGELKTTPKIEGGDRFILEETVGNLNGYPCEWTNLVPANTGTSGNGSAMIFGNWEDLFVGEWGGFDMVVDPFTQAGSAQTVITINAWNDALVAEPKSFAVLTGITTTIED